MTTVELIEQVFGKELAEIYQLNQLLLPQEERITSGTPCLNPQGTKRCTLTIGHSGQHIAHDVEGNIVQRWG